IGFNAYPGNGLCTVRPKDLVSCTNGCGIREIAC
ncbi:hypothetical protein A2U01_0080680, partial [Trifolium medium]|nr:hypothetical protein [Trifolium medium]